MTESEQLAYIAGFIDGEGSIGIVSVAKHKRYVVQIAACNCNRAPIDLLRSLYGGKVRKRTWNNKRWKPSYEWKLTAKKAVNAINAILPFLMIKREQAEIVLEANKLKNQRSPVWYRWHPTEKEKRDTKLLALKEKCGRLNKRGK